MSLTVSPADLKLDTKPLLRPAQLESAKEERQTLEAKLRSPHIQDKGEVQRQIRRLDSSLKTQAPEEFKGKDVDKAKVLEAELRGKILDGMPSHEEMRKNPPGAVAKHLAWEKRNKQNMELWKNLQLRLNVGTNDPDIANFEKYRPHKSSLNMDGAQISGNSVFLPPVGVAPATVFSAEQIEMLKQLFPDVASRLALMSNEERSIVKDHLNGEQTEI